MDCPDFNLAELTPLDPRVFMSGDDGVDGFVLSIALAYNDIKGIDWLGQQMENCRPTDTTTVSAGLGSVLSLVEK